jgi:hypothetical protein
MAEHGDLWRKNIPEDFDGRFGDQFDDEIKPRGVVEVAIGLVLTCVVAMVITWWILVRTEEQVQAAGVANLSPLAEANEPRLPEGPRLQAHPEAELVAMRAEMATRLHGYGWVDEGAGIVHIPIDRAMDLLLDGAMAASASEDGTTSAESEEEGGQ